MSPLPRSSGASNVELGERMSSLEAKVGSFEKYEHERWHALNNTLQPLTGLSERMTREIGRLHGAFDTKVSTLVKDIERSITQAVEKAVGPLNTRVASIEARLEQLEDDKQRRDGATNVFMTICKSPMLGWLVGALLATWALFSGRTN